MPGRLLLAIATAALVTTLLVAGARRTIPPENVCPDFIQFWTTAVALSSGEDPYDVALQSRVQGSLGWKKDADGLGVYDFLPYYYPPWLGMAFLPMLPLGYPLAKLVWLVVGGQMLLAAGVLLGSLLPGVGPAMALVATAAFGFSIKAVAMGQVAPLVLLLVASAWWLLEKRRDAAAGAVLALLTVKPQLGFLLIGVVLVWAARRGRWRVVGAFAATLGVLVAASFAVFPGWLPAMLAAPRETPMPTAYYPGLGATWLVVLQAFGLSGVPLYVLYGAVAAVVVAVLARMTWRDAPLETLIAMSLVAPFFLAPYARPYDFPVLLVPALVWSARREGTIGRAFLPLLLVLAGGLHLLYLTVNSAPPVVGVRREEFAYFWIPLVVALAWLLEPAAERRSVAALADTEAATTPG